MAPAGTAADVRAAAGTTGGRATARAADTPILRSRLPAIALAALLAACGGGGGGPSPTPTLFTHSAKTYLLTIDQLRVAEFTVEEAAHTVGYSTVSAGDPQLAQALRAAGMRDAATVRYFRDVPDLATADGFIDMRSTVLDFASGGDAHRAFLAEERHTDAVARIVPESTDALGDEAHADLLTETSPEGVPVIEVTVITRHANLLEIVVIRGRQGGTSLADALILAHRQLAAQP